MTSWPDVLTIDPIAHARGAVRLPGSKSISNRALLLAALADGDTTLVGLLDADDTRVMQTALGQLGIDVRASGDGVVIRGADGRFPAAEADLHLGNAGTAFRSLTAALAFAHGNYRLDGVARMRERPIGDLVDALNALGAHIRYEGENGFPPIVVGVATGELGREVDIKGDVSSQFVSGLLMAAPMIAPASGISIRVVGELISRPYVDMTVAMMERFGAHVDATESGYVVHRSRYRSPGRFVVEGDASSASYFLALGAIAGGPVRVLGVGSDSVQGDVRFADALKMMGARITMGSDWIESAPPNDRRLRAIDFDATLIPDAAMTLAIVALFAQGTTRLRGIGSWRVKETDRIAAMATELRKLGAQVAAGADWISIEPPVQWTEATIDTYDDHRMAMCLALTAAAGVPAHIRDPKCVSKTFPGFFGCLAELVEQPAMQGRTA